MSKMSWNNVLTVLYLLGLFSISNAGLWSATSDSTSDSSHSSGGGADESVEYGVDVSFPMHYAQVSTNYPWLPHNKDPSLPVPKEYQDMVPQPLGNKQEFYRQFLQGCKDAFGKKGTRCTQNELDRIAMTLRQPQSMQNYTKVGYKKIKAPEKVWKMVKQFWDNNHMKAQPESWGIGNTYTNNWEVPTKMVSVEDSGLRGGGKQLKQSIWDAARDTIEEWTGQELTQCSLYGVRIYYEGSILAPHVDRLPLVSSAIINVAQDLDEPWPLEVIGHDGRAQNVTMEPGDMVLYESHSVIHGRPFPMKGRFFANIFIHFEPVGHSLRFHGHETDAGKDVDEKYRDALSRGLGGHEAESDGLPPYIIAGTPEETHWRQAHPGGQRSKRKSFNTGSTLAHHAAQGGDLGTLKREVEKKKDIVNATDANGWAPIHEGVRGGHLDVVKFLVENGADVNAKTSEAGGTPLWWAKQNLEDNDPVISFLESIGALEIGPEL
ncbi:2-oxyglutarate/Fe(II) oxygenase [Nitzschia inconspicua]|uniref:2-oxyglutarate/Fe(II) oxygenase n=1 Tax=Nitzschia inconspicua TaxID=303405 RepID=A0A9K3LF02_9STRA|nr:2-oxyglutarate/Fe(II) oxygenase [Nitzschia inconspicua]